MVPALLRLFRGLTAAASLKLHLCGGGLDSVLLFRGLTAAASLKPGPEPARQIDRVVALPRPHRRGLIEAISASMSGVGMRLRLFRGLTAAASLKPQR